MCGDVVSTYCCRVDSGTRSVGPPVTSRWSHKNCVLESLTISCTFSIGSTFSRVERNLCQMSPYADFSIFIAAQLGVKSAG